MSRKSARGWRRTLGALVVLVALGAWLYGTMRDTVQSGVRIGESIPAVTLSSLAGPDVSLANFSGRPLLIRFSSTSCQYCTNDFSVLQAIQESVGERLQVVAIQAGDTASVLASAVGGRRLTYPVLVDPANVAASAFQPKGLPMLYFVTRSGELSSAVWGEVGETNLLPHLERLF